MGKGYARFALVLTVVVAGILAVTPREQRLGTGLGFVGVLLLVGVLMNPAIRRTALQNKQVSLILGLVAIGVGVCVLAVGILFPLLVSAEFGASAFAMFLLTGLLLIQLPRMSATVDGEIAARKSADIAPASPQGFDPVEEARRSLATILEHRAALRRVVGPWFLGFCAVPLVLLDIGFWKTLLDRRPDLGILLVLGLVLIILVEIGLLMVAAIQWIRFIATHSEPSWSEFPHKALWRFFWRWIVFASILRTTNGIAPWLKTHIPSIAPWQLDGLNDLVFLLILVMASPFALTLPAIALDAGATGIGARTKAFRLVGRKFYLGAALILAPYFTLNWVIGIGLDLSQQPDIRIASAIASIIFLFATAIVGATYLTRIYLRGTPPTRADAA